MTPHTTRIRVGLIGAIAVVSLLAPTVASAESLDLSSYRNHKGICHTPLETCDYDEVGYGYSGLALQAVGVSGGTAIEADGLTYTWPDVSGTAFDNVTAVNQRIPVDAGDATKIGFLGAAHHGPAFTKVTLHYVAYDEAGGETPVAVEVPLIFSDWTLAGSTVDPSPRNTIAVEVPVRQFGPAVMPTTSYAFSLAVDLDPAMALVAVELPRATNVRLWDIALG